MQFSKKLFTTLTLLFAVAVVAAACTPKQASDVADTMMEDKSSDDAMMEDKSDDAMMEGDDKMEGDAMMEDKTGDAMMEGDDKMMADDSVVTFDVTGENFAFSQTEIRVKEGDTVRINFTSTDGFHDWVVDEFDAATQKVNTGGSTSVEFVADKAGSYEFYCSVGQHRQLGMVGTLIVE